MTRNPTEKIAPAKNRDRIRKDVYNLRRQLRLPKKQRVDILAVLEFALPIVDPDFHLIPVEDHDLQGRYAVTRPLEHAIYVKQSVYDAAYRESGWARMILAHELGHYYCHDIASITYAYLDQNERLSPDIDPERQADIFAAEFLAPSGELKGMSTWDVQKKYGISQLAAKNQLRQASNLQRRQAQKRRKRSGKKA
ncbi:MAG: ImmA/IrrE family metallo-endopeptidase [Oscillibacter sp.]|nr:ImmA/IrrE family metallo-endopeptidase [Oscillibacter sp.]